jgi:hypothetical protein
VLAHIIGSVARATGSAIRAGMPRARASCGIAVYLEPPGRDVARSSLKAATSQFF